MLEHRGYIGSMKVEPDDECIYGHLLGIRDIISFEGNTVAEAKASFIKAVDDYLRWCEEDGKEPDKPFSGKFVLRLPAELHKRIALAADTSGKSLNTLVVEALVERFGRAGKNGEAEVIVEAPKPRGPAPKRGGRTATEGVSGKAPSAPPKVAVAKPLVAKAAPSKTAKAKPSTAAKGG